MGKLLDENSLDAVKTYVDDNDLFLYKHHYVMTTYPKVTQYWFDGSSYTSQALSAITTGDKYFDFISTSSTPLNSIHELFTLDYNILGSILLKAKNSTYKNFIYAGSVYVEEEVSGGTTQLVQYSRFIGFRAGGMLGYPWGVITIDFPYNDTIASYTVTEMP